MIELWRLNNEESTTWAQQQCFSHLPIQRTETIFTSLFLAFLHVAGWPLLKTTCVTCLLNVFDTWKRKGILSFVKYTHIQPVITVIGVQSCENMFMCTVVSPELPFAAAAEQMVLNSLLFCLMTTHQHRQQHLWTHWTEVINHKSKCLALSNCSITRWCTIPFRTELLVVVITGLLSFKIQLQIQRRCFLTRHGRTVFTIHRNLSHFDYFSNACESQQTAQDSESVTRLGLQIRAIFQFNFGK